jgi:hypothetical protein
MESEAYRLRRALVDLDDTNTRWRKDLALSHETLGDLANAQREASEIAKRMLGRDPKNVAAQALLAEVEKKISVPVSEGQAADLRACANS